MKSNLTLIAGIMTAIAFVLYVIEIVVMMDSLIYLYFKEKG